MLTRWSFEVNRSPADFIAFPCGCVGQLQIRDWFAEPDFVPKTAEARMKFSGSKSFDRVGEYGIMKKRNHPESTDRERPTPCAR